MGNPIDKLALYRQRQRFSKEFKLAAIALLKGGQKPGTQIALELGIARNLLYKWAAQLDVKAGNTQAAFNGSGRKLLAQQPEIEHLKRELARVTEERDILKRPQRTLPGNCREVRLH